MVSRLQLCLAGLALTADWRLKAITHCNVLLTFQLGPMAHLELFELFDL